MKSFNEVRKITRGHFALAGAALACLLAQPVRADLLELTNGDHYRGTVISMTASNLEFLSEIQGRVTLPRAKVAQITFHEVIRPAAHVTSNAPLILSGPNTASTAIAPAANAPAVAAPVPSMASMQVIEQMRQQGMDPKLISQVQEQIFGKSSPEAASKFNQMMGGLMSGQMSIKDLQAQAQQSINQIRAAKKELGPDAGEMLDGYLTILEKFVQDAATDTTPPAQK